MNNPVRILIGDVLDGLRSLPDGSVQCCVTSPPYYQLRDYGIDGQIGLEPTPEAFVAKMVEVFAEVRRVLRKDGVCFLNIGDSYAKEGVSGLGLHTETSTTGKPNPYATVRKSIPSGLKPKDLCMIPWRVALALQADGWYLRSVIVWAKKSPMPESVTDRPTSSWEPIFLLAKSERYFYDAEAVREPNQTPAGAVPSVDDMPKGDYQDRELAKQGVHRGAKPCINPDGRNQRNVWHLGPEPFKMSGQTVHWLPVEADAVGDDIRRTLSEGCPVHDRRDSHSCGEHEGDASSRSLGTGSHLAPTPDPAPCTSSQTAYATDPACSLGSFASECSQTASARSTQSRRTGRVPSTIQPCTPCAQTGDGTRGTPETHEFAVPRHGTHANTPSAGSEQCASGSDPSAQTTSGSGCMCTCQYHRRTTKKIDHFATFPTEIPRRGILAGTSEKGACPDCGAPWRRDNKAWQPTCKCGNPNTVPCVVLDPFLGSGTTIAVARTLGRHGVGCELNPTYAELARERIGKAEKPSTFVSDKAADAWLFMGEAK